MEGDDGCDGEGEEEHGQSRFALREAGVEETQAGEDEEDYVAAEDDVGIVELEAGEGRVDVGGESVAAIGGRGVELGDCEGDWRSGGGGCFCHAGQKRCQLREGSTNGRRAIEGRGGKEIDIK